MQGPTVSRKNKISRGPVRAESKVVIHGDLLNQPSYQFWVASRFHWHFSTLSLTLLMEYLEYLMAPEWST